MVFAVLENKTKKLKKISNAFAVFNARHQTSIEILRNTLFSFSQLIQLIFRCKIEDCGCLFSFNDQSQTIRGMWESILNHEEKDKKTMLTEKLIFFNKKHDE